MHQGKLIHAKVQDPSLANWFGLAWRCATADFRLSHLQQELRSLVLRQRSVPIATLKPCSDIIAVRRAQGTQYIPDLRAAQPGRLSRQAADCRHSLRQRLRGLRRRSARPRP
jgi:hypothetical protein